MARGDGQALGPVQFGAKTSAFFREQIELPFFEFHLKGKGEWKPPEAWVFLTGRNEWQRFDAWPPKTAKTRTLCLAGGGRLRWEPRPDGKAGFDEYLSDPARPVPFLTQTAIGMSYEYMVDDQRPAARRPDVLVYQTEPLEADLTVAGPIDVKLLVSTSGTDSDWIVKLIDVYPPDHPDPDPNPAGVRLGGYQQLIRGDVMRGKFRRSLERPEPLVPSEPTEVRFTMPDVLHAFRPGHRIMVQVQSTWFPLVDRNAQKFVDLSTAAEADFQKATQRVYRGGERGSRLVVRVLP